jgi:hypothetical protein
MRLKFQIFNVVFLFFYMQNKSVDIYNAEFNRLNEYIHTDKKFVSDRIGSDRTDDRSGLDRIEPMIDPDRIGSDR